MEINNIFTKIPQVSYSYTVCLSDCYYPMITDDPLHIHEIQLGFIRLHDDINFGLMVVKIQAKFNKYLLYIPIMFDLGMLTNPYMKEKGLIIILNFYILNYVMKSWNASMIFIAMLDYYLKSIIPSKEVTTIAFKNVLVWAKISVLCPKRLKLNHYWSK